MNADEIITGFCDNVLRDKASNKVFPNVYFLHYEADVLEITKSGYSYEYEVKISKSDFKNDYKKSCGWECNSSTNFERKTLYKFDDIKSGKRVNYFYYIVPVGLISIEDIPEFAGLIYAEKREIGLYSNDKGHYSKVRIYYTTIKAAPKLSKEKFCNRILFKCLESTYYRFHKLRKEPNNNQ